MAEQPIFSTDAQPTLQQLVDYLVDSLYDGKKLAQLQRTLRNAHAEGTTVAHGAMAAAVEKSATDVQGALTTTEDYARGAMAWALAHLVAHLLGIDVPPDALRDAFKG